MTHVAFLHAMSFWSPATSAEPETDWVSPRLLRGASRFTRMLLHTAERVVREGGADPKTVATVYGSQYGEIETMCILLDAIFRGDGQLSPMRFKNSVHNAGSGLGSIGQGNRAFSTAIAAGAHTFEVCLLEAWSVLFDNTTRAEDVAIVVADDHVPDALAAADKIRAPLAVGVLLSRTRKSSTSISLANISGGSQEWPEVLTFAANKTIALEAEQRDNPAAHAAMLAQTFFAAREALSVPLFLGGERAVCLNCAKTST